MSISVSLRCQLSTVAFLLACFSQFLSAQSEAPRTLRPRIGCSDCATATILSGDGQSGTVSTVLQQPLSVKIIFNFDGTPLETGVVFTLISPPGSTGGYLIGANGGEIHTGQQVGVATGPDGTTSVQLRLGNLPGPYQITMYCSDTFGCGTLTFNETAVSAPLTITTTSLSPGTFEQTNYVTSLSATGGNPPYVNWIVTGMPDGLNVSTNPDGTGQLAGSFAADAEHVSTFDPIKRRFTMGITVTDSTGVTAVATLELPWTCGGDGSKDALINQYLTFRAGAGVLDIFGSQFVPRCLDITNGANTVYYSFRDLNTSNTTAPTVALLANSLISGMDVFFTPGPFGAGLDSWVNAYGSIPIHPQPCNASPGGSCLINSGFRPPADQQRVYDVLNAVRASQGKQALPVPAGGRHMLGDAVDLPVPDLTKAKWDLLVHAAIEAGASFVENVGKDYPCNPVNHVCVHADWRDWTKTYAQ